MRMNPISEGEYKKFYIAGEAERFSEGEARPMSPSDSSPFPWGAD